MAGWTVGADGRSLVNHRGQVVLRADDALGEAAALRVVRMAAPAPQLGEARRALQAVLPLVRGAIALRQKYARLGETSRLEEVQALVELALAGLGPSGEGARAARAKGDGRWTSGI